MNKILKILLIITVCLMIIITIFVKVKINHEKKDDTQKSREPAVLQDNHVIIDEDGYILKGSKKDSADPSTEKRLEKHEFVKGFVSYIGEDGFIEIHNSYMIDSLGMTIAEYNHFFTKIPFSPNDVSFVNYYTSEEMKLEEISWGKLLLFNAKIIYSTLEEPIITLEDNKIFVLNEKDLYNMALDKYKGQKVLKDVKIVGKNDYNFEGKDYKYLYAQVKFNTSKNDELVYCFTLQLTDNTTIEDSQNSKYADIILEDNFENTVESAHYNYCRKVDKIIYR